MKKYLLPSALFLFPFLLYADLLSGEKIRGYFDLLRYAYPDRFFGMGQMAAGVIPLWNPYLLCGLPYLANWQSALLYPLNLTFFVMPFAAAYNVFGLLHLGLAALGTYLFCRQLGLGRLPGLLSGLTFSLCAYPQMILNYPSHVSAYAWLPFLLFLGQRAVERRGYLLPLFFVAAFQLYAGYPHTLLYSLILLALYLLYSYRPRRVGGVLLPLLFALLLLGAVQLLPFLEFALSARRLGEWQFAYSLPLAYLATLFKPFALGQPGGPAYGGELAFSLYELYGGILSLPLLLVAFIRPARASKFFVYLTPLVLIYLLGDNTPLGRTLLALPGASCLEFAKALPVFCFCLAVSAGVGLERLSAWVSSPWRHRLAAALLCLAVFDLACLRWQQELVPNPFAVRSGSAPMLLAERGGGRLLSLRPSSEAGRGFRLAGSRSEAMREMVDSIQPNVNMVYGLPSLNGFLSMIPASFDPVRRYYQSAYPYRQGELFQRANLYYFILPDELPEQEYQLLAQGQGVRLYRLRARRARAYLSDDLLGKTPLAGGQVSYRAPEPGLRQIELDAPRRAWLFISEDISVGWSAFLDGQAVSLTRAEPCFASLRVPAGKHSLVLTYTPASFLVGLFITLFSILSLAVIACGLVARKSGH